MALTLPNGARFTIKGQWSNGRPVYTTWHAVVVDNGVRPAAVADAANSIAAAWILHVVPLLANNYSFQVVNWLDIASTAGASGDHVVGSPVTGGSVTNSLSPYNGIVVTKQITDKGRGRRSGRTFIPGITAASVGEDGVVTAQARDAASDALELFMQDFNGDQGINVAAQRLVVAHTPFVEETKTITRKVPLKTGTMTSSDITGFSSNFIVSGLKSRVDV